MMPFARNESTRFISPTKTPEYLAAGKPVVSTSIRDVVRPYGERGLVEIADTPEAFVAAVERHVDGDEDEMWFAAVDAFLSRMSWDATFAAMRTLVEAVEARSLAAEQPASSEFVRAPFGRLRPATSFPGKPAAEKP
jgi:hypothetical protein